MSPIGLIIIIPFIVNLYYPARYPLSSPPNDLLETRPHLVHLYGRIIPVSLNKKDIPSKSLRVAKACSHHAHPSIDANSL